MSKKVVLFGGTFDPIHKGHIEPVTQACQRIQAGQLIFIPCHIPPHKQTPKVTSQDRFNMVQLVAKELDTSLPFAVSCSDYELKQQGQSYTRKTVEYFQQQMPERELLFLIGMDSYINFTSWHKWQEILAFCQLLVLKRPGYQLAPLPELLTKRSQLIEVEQVDISSTELRQKLAGVDSDVLPDDLLNTAVKQYIAENKLYC